MRSGITGFGIFLLQTRATPKFSDIRYESKLTALDKTPQSVMAALSDYVEFPTEHVGPNVTSGAGQQEAQTVPEDLWLEWDSRWEGRH